MESPNIILGSISQQKAVIFEVKLQGTRKNLKQIGKLKITQSDPFQLETSEIRLLQIG